MVRSGLGELISVFVAVQPRETSALLHSFFCFFFILSAYFVVLPLRDEGAISLGLSNLPGLFVGSLLLTLIAAPVSTLIFSLPNLFKNKALVLIHRLFSVSLVLFFFLWRSSSTGLSASKLMEPTTLTSSLEPEGKVFDHGTLPSSTGLGNHGWFYITVRIGLFLWVSLLNLITISSTWARVIDVMDSEVQDYLGLLVLVPHLANSLGHCSLQEWLGWAHLALLLFAALLMEFAAQSSKGIHMDPFHLEEELTPIREADPDHKNGALEKSEHTGESSPKSSTSAAKLQDGLWLILSSTYLLHLSLFLWLSAVISSFFYFQKVTVIAATVTSSIGRRRLFAQINSFIAVFILVGQLTFTGRILPVAGVTIAICSAPSVGFFNLVALVIWPTWVVVAICETLRKVVSYVVTRPARELLFTVVSQDQKYKAKVCIDVFVQRLGDASAAGMYKLLLGAVDGKTSAISLYALPVCSLWIVTAFYLGRRQDQLAKPRTSSPSYNSL